MLGSTFRKRLLSMRPALMLMALSLLAILVAGSCVSCGNSSSHSSSTTTKTEKKSNPKVETTTTTATLTREIYDKIEMGMSYQKVRKIIGQDPNTAEEIEDPMRQGVKVLKCTWRGAEGSGEYQNTPELSVTLDGGVVYAKESSNL